MQTLAVPAGVGPGSSDLAVHEIRAPHCFVAINKLVLLLNVNFVDVEVGATVVGTRFGPSMSILDLPEACAFSNIPHILSLQESIAHDS